MHLLGNVSTGGPPIPSEAQIYQDFMEQKSMSRVDGLRRQMIDYTDLGVSSVEKRTWQTWTPESSFSYAGRIQTQGKRLAKVSNDNKDLEPVKV